MYNLWLGVGISFGISFLLNWAGCAITARMVKKPIRSGRYYLYCLLVNFVIMIIWVALMTTITYLVTGEFLITGSSINLAALFLWTAVGMMLTKNTLSKRGLLIEPEKEKLKEEINSEIDENKKKDLMLCELSLGDHYSYNSDYAWLIHLKEQTKSIKTDGNMIVYDILIQMVTDENGKSYARQIIGKYDSYKGNLKNESNRNSFITFVKDIWNQYNNASSPSQSNYTAKNEHTLNNENEYMFCRKCGAKMPKNSTFCAICGEKFIFISDKCPYCGKQLLEGARFCNKCGKAV